MADSQANLFTWEEVMPEDAPQDAAPSAAAAPNKPTTKKTATKKTTTKRDDPKTAKKESKAAAGQKAAAKKISPKKPASDADKPKPPAKKVARSFPTLSLEDALVLAQTIRTENQGNPADTEALAKATFGTSKNTTRFFYLAAASRDYDLTIGTRDTERIELSKLGRKVVFATSEDQKRQSMIDAFFAVDIFKRVFDYYGGGKLASGEFLTNALENDFQIDPSLHDDFVRIFKANCEYLEISDGLKPEEKNESRISAVSDKEVRSVGEPKGKFDRTAFVIMPFVEKGDRPRPSGYFDEVLKTLITPAANAAGFAVETAEQDGSDVIQSTIINLLLEKDLVIADLTDHNPNVLFELGIRIARELPVVLIKAEGTGRIFDVDNMMRVFSYSPNLWATTVAKDVPKLQAHVKAAWDNRDVGRGYMQLLTGHKPQSLLGESGLVDQT